MALGILRLRARERARFDVRFIGNGVVRWVAAKREEEGEPLDGKTFSVEFGGAPDRKYMVTCDGDNYLVHLMPSYYLDRPDRTGGAAKLPGRAGRATGHEPDNGGNGGNGRECPPAPGKRLRRPVEPWPRSRRNIRGVGQPDGLPLKKWML